MEDKAKKIKECFARLQIQSISSRSLLIRFVSGIAYALFLWMSIVDPPVLERPRPCEISKYKISVAARLAILVWCVRCLYEQCTAGDCRRVVPAAQ